MEEGEVVQFGRPAKLLSIDGLFKTMCLESGEYDELVKLSRH
jgi:ABC-type multidrug transport system fused ATPase/permease subunit